MIAGFAGLHINNIASLLVIVILLAGGIIFSLWKNRSKKPDSMKNYKTSI
jgi:hypothetical protein